MNLVARKAQENTEKVKTGLLKIKFRAQRVKALAEEKKETKLREQEELLCKVDKIALSAEKSKGKEASHHEKEGLEGTV